MNRNFEVARSVLHSVQEHADLSGIDRLHLCSLFGEAGASQTDWQYALGLMVGGGYLTSDGGKVQLTWAGHELLDELSC